MTKTSKPSLAETHPGLAAQAHGWDPELYNSNSRAVKFWKCRRKSHYFEASISGRVKGFEKCWRCESDIRSRELRHKQQLFAQKTNPKEKSPKRHWAEIHPEIAAQADGWDPRKATNGSKIERNWICQRKHHFKMSVVMRVKSMRGCNKCGKWQPRKVFIWELADLLFLDRIELLNFSKNLLAKKPDMRKKLSVTTAEKIVDAWYDINSTKKSSSMSSSNEEIDWGHQTNTRWSINERCSSCDLLFDPQRPHECRNY